MSAPATRSIIECAVATHPSAPRASGDGCLVIERGDSAFVAVIDGLGHGEEAEVAMLAAKEALREAVTEPLTVAIERCHARLFRTRGAVMSLAHLHGDGSMTWIGVGNVEGVVIRGSPGVKRKEYLLQRAGVVGYQLPPLRESRLSIARDDLLVFATDGIKTGIADQVRVIDSPRNIADALLKWGDTKTDDALVLVVRYLGRQT